MRTGCLEGENYRVVNRTTITEGQVISRVKYGGDLMGQSKVIKTEKVDDEFGKMTIEFLNPEGKDNIDTSLFPRGV
jgi:hypothetical protein